MKVKLLRKGSAIPLRESKFAAGFDLRWCPSSGCRELIVVNHGETSALETGVAIQIPDGFVGLIKPRSSLAKKFGLDVMAGVIDSDYRGEINVLLTKLDYGGTVIKSGQRIAQIIIIPCVLGAFEVVDELSTTGRGSGGFGSTGEL